MISDNIWFTSDTHYAHTNICRGVTRWGSYDDEGVFHPAIESTRDYASLEIMNDLLVSGINDNVGENDWLIHIGDWSFGGIEKIQEFRDKINCKNIVLIIGNHDHHIERNTGNTRRFFSRVAHYEELKVKGVGNFVLCHYPIISWNGMYKGSYMIHGHQHLNNDRKIGEGRRMDVGVDGSPDFRPYHIEEVIELLSPRFKK